MSASETAEAILIVIKRLAKWAMVLVLGAIALGVLAWGGTTAYQHYKNRPYPITKYAGVTLGDTQATVTYVKGIPTDVLDSEVVAGPEDPWKGWRAVIKVADIEKGKSVEDYLEWQYQGTDDRVDIAFDETQRLVSDVRCYSHEYLGCEPIFGLQIGSAEDEVRRRLGKPALEEVKGGVKTMHYAAFNLTIYLEKERIYMFKVARPATSGNP